MDLLDLLNTNQQICGRLCGVPHSHSAPSFCRFIVTLTWVMTPLETASNAARRLDGKDNCNLQVRQGTGRALVPVSDYTIRPRVSRARSDKGFHLKTWDTSSNLEMLKSLRICSSCLALCRSIRCSSLRVQNFSFNAAAF